VRVCKRLSEWAGEIFFALSLNSPLSTRSESLLHAQARVGKSESAGGSQQECSCERVRASFVVCRGKCTVR